MGFIIKEKENMPKEVTYESLKPGELYVYRNSAPIKWRDIKVKLKCGRGYVYLYCGELYDTEQMKCVTPVTVEISDIRAKEES